MTPEQKQQKWQELVNWCEQLDPHYPVDPGIKETVIVLNALDIPTAMSCEGHLHGPFSPWIKIAVPTIYQDRKRIQHARNQLRQQQQQLDPAEARLITEYIEQYEKALIEKHLPFLKRLYGYLAAFYEKRLIPFEQRLILSGGDGLTGLSSQGGALMEMLSLEERQKRLPQYQGEMQAFTSFLKDIYFSS